MIAPIKIKATYWTEFKPEPADIDFIYAVLLERSVPLSCDDLLLELLRFHVKSQVEKLEKQSKDMGDIYLPKEEFAKGVSLIFPALDMRSGKVMAVRDGFNPEYEALKVIEVKLDSGEVKNFASNLGEHALNDAINNTENDPNLDPEQVLAQYGETLKDRLAEALNSQADLVLIAGKWFPRSLLVDIGVGHLNLAEAVLEEAGGGPLTITALMKQVELAGGSDAQLIEFSFDLALQEDKRFDEVGPAGETLWYLHDKEPEEVKQSPLFLKFTQHETLSEKMEGFLELFEGNLYDELEPWDSPQAAGEEISISLIYPHLRSGTLPLSNSLKRLFPTAHEAPRVRFTFKDDASKKEFPGWVVRPFNYIYGLRDWYAEHDLMPGSLVKVKQGQQPGEILIHFEKSRQNKEWLKTVLIGSDHGIVFAMLKHNINAEFNERMAVAIPDTTAVDEIWTSRLYEKEPLEKTILRVTRELAKLNPQGQVHAQELYAAINVVRRCPPSLALQHLIQQPLITHLGDLYFRLGEKEA